MSALYKYTDLRKARVSSVHELDDNTTMSSELKMPLETKGKMKKWRDEEEDGRERGREQWQLID